MYQLDGHRRTQRKRWATVIMVQVQSYSRTHTVRLQSDAMCFAPSRSGGALPAFGRAARTGLSGRRRCSWAANGKRQNSILSNRAKRPDNQVRIYFTTTYFHQTQTPYTFVRLLIGCNNSEFRGHVPISSGMVLGIKRLFSR